RFLKDRGRLLAAEERDWLEAQQRAWLSVWEVTDVKPGVGMSMQDLLTGQERFIHEVSGSRCLSKRHVILGRMVDFCGVTVACGMHPRPLPPREGAALAQGARKVLRLARRHVPVQRLRTNEAVMALLLLWEMTVEAMDNRPLPKLQNTDGQA